MRICSPTSAAVGKVRQYPHALLTTLHAGGVVQWELKANGYMFHSGFPNKAINAIELANLAVQHIQTCFYRDFPT